MISGETVLLIIIILINIALWIAFFIRLKRTFSPHAILSDIKNEVEKLLIEINKTALDNVTLIEDRAKNIQLLIEDADRRIGLMYSQEENKKREQAVFDRLSNNSSSRASKHKAAQSYKKMSNDTAPNLESEAVQLSINFDSYHIEETVENVEESIVTPEITQAVINSEEGFSLKQRVLQLAADDFSAEYIAHKVGTTITEVQLIIDLNT